MKRIKNADINFKVNPKRINLNNFSMKFYTVNSEAYFFTKDQNNLVSVERDATIYDEDVIISGGTKVLDYYLPLDWSELVQLGEGVLNYRCINNIEDPYFPDMAYNQVIEDTTGYYIDSDIIVDPSQTRNIIERVTELESGLAVESIDREEADTFISGAVENEIARAISAETELSDRISYIESGTTEALEAEIARAISAETAIRQDLTDESEIRSSADTAMWTAVNNEITRASSAETAIDNKVDVETLRAIGVENAISGNLETYKATNNAALQAETTRATSAETALQTAIGDEATARANADAALGTRIDNISSASTAAIEAEAARAQEAESGLTNAINNEVTRATSAETIIANSLNAEINRASSAETALNNQIDAEVLRATAKENDLEAKIAIASGATELINAETSRAISVENVLSGAIDTLDAKFIDDAKYEDSGNTKVINFYNGNTVKATIDCTDFLVDGMIDDVRIENGYLVIDFNTASGKQDIQIPLTDIFNPANYYTKSETSGATELATAFAATQPKLSAGTGIDITNDVISVTGGGGGVNVVQTTGTSTTDVMSQDAVTTEINNKANKSAAVGGYKFGSANNVDYLQYTNVNKDNIGNGIYYPKINGKGIFTNNLTYAENNYNFQLVETSAITTSVTSASTDSQVPSAKAVYNAIQEGGGQTYTAGDGIDITNDVISVTGKTNQSDFTGHITNTSIHVTTAQTAAWDAKSDFSGSYNDLTDKPTIPTVPTNVSDFTNDAGYATSGYVDSSVSGKVDTTTYNAYTAATDAALSGKADTATTYTKTEVDNAITAATSTKQDTLVSGTNIKTINNTSILGSGNIDIQGGGKAVSAGRGISVTTGETADTVSFNLPISAGTGNNSLVFGRYGAATGQYSAAFGNGSNAFNNYAFAIGGANNANGQSSFAGGEGLTSAIASGSFAFGYNAETRGECSVALGGYFLRTNNDSEIALGKANVSNTGSTDADKTLFSVGNGTNTSARHNAFEVRQNGDIYLSSGGTDIKLQDHLGGGGGGGISSAECQTMIDNSISGKADSDDVYTTGQTSGATELATAFAATQPKLSAGTGISIDANNVISATGGGGGGMTEDDELLLSTALTDLNDRKIDASEVKSNYQKKGDYVTTSTLNTRLADYETALDEQNVEEVTSYALNDLNTRLGGLALVKITESEYAALTTKDENTLYIVVADPS